MKVSRARDEIPQQNRSIYQLMHDHMSHQSLALQLAARLEQARFVQGSAIDLTNALPDDEVDMACFIFERYKGYAARTARTLACNHNTGNAYWRAMLRMHKLRRRQHLIVDHFSAQ